MSVLRHACSCAVSTASKFVATEHMTILECRACTGYKPFGPAFDTCHSDVVVMAQELLESDFQDALERLVNVAYRLHEAEAAVEASRDKIALVRMTVDRALASAVVSL